MLKPACGEGPRANLLGSGTILFDVLKTAEQLRGEGFAVAVYSITSYLELARDAERSETADVDCQQSGGASVRQLFDQADVPTVAATDYVRALPRMIATRIPGPYTVLGTDGFGLSEGRELLREHFGVDASTIAGAARHLCTHIDAEQE